MRIRILVVDFSRGGDSGEHVRRVLSGAGYEVVLLEEPDRLLECVTRSSFHLVLIDTSFPMQGPEVLATLRDAAPDLGLVVMRHEPTVLDALAALRAQALDYLAKPARDEEVVETVRGALARKGIFQDAGELLKREIGRNVHQVRKAQGLTLKQLAARTGLSVSQLSQVERATSAPSILSLYKIASALQMKMSDLFREA